MKRINKISLFALVIVFVIYVVAFHYGSSNPNDMNAGNFLILMTYFAFGALDDMGITYFQPADSSSLPLAIIVTVSVFAYIAVFLFLLAIRFLSRIVRRLFRKKS